MVPRRRVAVAYDEFTEDILENRLLRAALMVLCRLPVRTAGLHAKLAAALMRFDMVTDIVFDRRDVPKVQFSRLNAHYENTIELARLILEARSYEHRGRGSVLGQAFLIDMNKVFEDFLVVSLRESLGLDARIFPQGANGHKLYLDNEAHVRLKPDLSWWVADRCAFVGDAKYKYISDEKVHNADIYQMLAYLTATGLQRGLLIYGSGLSEPGTIKIPGATKRIDLCCLDLTKPPKELLEQIEQLGFDIRRSRQKALAVRGDWEIVPMPKRSKHIPMNIRISHENMKLIRRGVVPEQMEDKWFIFCDKDVLYLHRSWTGFCVYEVRFRDRGQYIELVDVVVNCDPAQYKVGTDEYEASLLVALIENLLLGHYSPVPVPAGDKETAVLQQWSLVGRAMFTDDDWESQV